MGFFEGVLGIGGDGGAGDTIDQSIAGIQGLKGPSADDLTYKIQDLVQQGVLSPEQAQAFLVEHSSFDDVATDPRLRAAQMDALSSLSNIANSGGLTATDRAKLEEITSREGQAERGSREAILQRSAEMGRSGSGLDLAAQLENEQGAATRSSQQGSDLAATAEQRALEAIQQEAATGGAIRSQDFGEASQKAQAKDTLAQFNATHLQGTNASNVAARNAAQEANLAEKQRVADANAGNVGKRGEVAANAKETVFQNDLGKQKAISDALTAKANLEMEKAKQKSAFTGALIGAAGTAGAGYLSKSDERAKDIEGGAPDMDAFMESLRPLAFTYKEPASAGAHPGENVGVVAQDVEKTPVGKTMVRNTPDGKMLDMGKGFGVILAALAKLHDEIQEKEAA